MLKEIKYIKFNNYKPITLDGIYKGDSVTLSNLDFNINEIVNTEAPITLNTLKARLREAFNVKKRDIQEDKKLCISGARSLRKER